MRIQPTTWTFTCASELWCTANASTAPTAIRIRLTGRPTRVSSPSRVKEKRPRNPSVVMSRIPWLLRVFLERPHGEPGARDRRQDLAEPPAAELALLLEIVLAPVHQPVDGLRGRM